jgi:hypothetical protein
MIEQLISFVAAIVILVAYALQQNGKLAANGLTYISLNFISGIILGIVALRARQLGLTVLEFAWAGISAISLIRVFRTKRI